MASWGCWAGFLRLNHFYAVLLVTSVIFSVAISEEEANSKTLRETVLIVIFARNKGHTLPYFLGLLERLDYPKSRVALWIRSDHNMDDTVEVLQHWLSQESHHYHDVNYLQESSESFFEDEDGPHHWSDLRFRHIIRKKEEALHAARMMWADYVWFLDSDAFIVNNQTLNMLIAQQKTMIAPMLESLGAYSNYWCGMNEKFYYERTADYMPTLERKRTGCFEVPMIHSAVLINLRHEESKLLSYDPSKNTVYKVPDDDIIALALSAKSAGITMNVVNTEMFGYIMVPLESTHRLSDDYEQLTNLKTHILTDHYPMLPSTHLLEFLPKVVPDTLGFDQAYMINLIRRHERRTKMMGAFQELGVKVKLTNAVDGRLVPTCRYTQRRCLSGTREVPTDCYVVAEGYVMKRQTLLKALDTAFKLFYNCHMQYPDEAKFAWQAFQLIVYGLSQVDVYSDVLSLHIALNVETTNVRINVR